ncbi:MAG: hypothetical protein HQK61_08330, partial [Desulfamplus sp.]|nr:hypothetical protein [Desulfamplus sp.]
KNLPYYIRNVRTATDKNDEKGVMMQAHGLKGIAANSSANRLRESACQIELAAKSSDMSKVRLMMSDIEHRSEEFLSAVLAVINEEEKLE